MAFWNQLFLVMAGGALGAACRWLVVQGAAKAWGTAFPWGTWVVNLVGSLAIGLAAAYLDAHPTGAKEPWARYGLAVGFLGALTTFSAFGLDTLRLADDRQFLLAGLNVVVQVVVGLALVWIGLRVGREWF